MDTQSLEDTADKGKLADFVPLTNYRFVQFVNAGLFSVANVSRSYETVWPFVLL